MSYLDLIIKPKCVDCGDRATRILKNDEHQELGHYCGKCGYRAKREHDERERAAANAEENGPTAA